MPRHMWATRLQILVASGSGSALSLPKVPPPTLTSAAATGLSREALMAMTKAQVISSYTLRFDDRLGRTYTKEGVVEPYLAKAASGPSVGKAAPPTRPYDTPVHGHGVHCRSRPDARGSSARSSRACVCTFFPIRRDTRWNQA